MPALKDAVATLIAGAHAFGAHDNVTVVVVAVSDTEADECRRPTTLQST